ncbi:PREDICTED: uncharacterized protein LOC108774498 [Cyphomyrmex costatus]|uniref:uncharacterized protein LOC108774498 n=1 Tax=Cyphomyrmex costatus TaxID=456900 RepID=UPI00085235F4|nr:PREDICTED: uncharacterized protein LOC108774498 [Cyphomyrmex costatus]
MSNLHKLHLFNACIKSVLLYSCETWKNTDGLINKFQVFVNKCLRRILRLFWPNSPTNEELLRASKQEKIDTEIRRRKWKWIGHTLRKDPHNITRMAMEYNPQGKRKTGRSAMSWRRTIDNEIKSIGKCWTEIKTIDQNRILSFLIDGLEEEVKSSGLLDPLI